MENVMEKFMGQYEGLKNELKEAEKDAREIDWQIIELELHGNQLPYLMEESLDFRLETLLKIRRLKEELKPFEGIVYFMKSVVK